MSIAPGILARGPWQPADIEVRWSEEPYAAPPEAVDEADRVLAQLRDRGSPAHDGLAARLTGYEVDDGTLRLECEPARWALRLLEGGAAQSLSAWCVVRAQDGRWLAGWPPDVGDWPEQADAPLRRLGELLTDSR